MKHSPFSLFWSKTWLWCLQPRGRPCFASREKLTVFVTATTDCRLVSWKTRVEFIWDSLTMSTRWHFQCFSAYRVQNTAAMYCPERNLTGLWCRCIRDTQGHSYLRLLISYRWLLSKYTHHRWWQIFVYKNLTHKEGQTRPGSLCFLHVSQGSAVLKQRLLSSEGEQARLHHACLQLQDDQRGKNAAAQVDQAVIRMRRQQVDKRAMPSFLQRGACRNQLSLSGAQSSCRKHASRAKDGGEINVMWEMFYSVVRKSVLIACKYIWLT